MFEDWKIQYHKVADFPKLIYRFNIIQLQLQQDVCVCVCVLPDKLIQKCIWKRKGTRITKILMKKNRMGGFVIPDIKTFYRTIITKTL